MRNANPVVKNYFQNLSSVLFFNNFYFGVLLFTLLALFDPRLFLYGFVSSLVGYAYSTYYSTPKLLKDSGLITINCFFFGIAMAGIFEGSQALWICLLLGAVGIPILTKAMYEILQHWKLSPSLMPYILTFWIIALASYGPTFDLQTIAPQDPTTALPDSIFLKIIWTSFVGMARVFFLSSPFFGFGLLALVSAFSPRRGFFFCFGTIVATAVVYILSSGSASWEFGAYSYSAGLIGLGLASLPERYQWQTILLYCVLSSVLTMALEQLLAGQRLPALTLPFVISYWVAILSRVPRISISWAPSATSR